MQLNSKIVAAVLATSMIAFGVTASAQPGGAGCDMMGPMGQQGMGGMKGGPGMRGGMVGDPAARVEQRMGQIKSELKITPQQEPLWQAYAEKVKAEAGQGMKAMREKQDQSMAAPERMAQRMAMMKERMAAMESVHDSFKRLYDSLSAEQKAIADRQAAQIGHMGPRGRAPGGNAPQRPQN